MRKCPFCAEEIQEQATFCRWCRADLSTAPAAGLPAKPETSGMAVASLVCGLVFLFFPAAVAAVILGHLSRSDIRRSGGRKTGSGMALAGLVMGYIGVSIIPILIIAAIAIPNLLRARITANEASAVGSMRTLSNAVMQYASTQRKLPQNILELGPQGADLIDPVLASGQKSGYRFSYELTDRDNDGFADGYQVRAEPITPGTTGVRHFYSDESGVIRMSSEGSADEHSPPVGSA